MTKTKYLKIPFIWTEAKAVRTPLDFNILGKYVRGDNKTGLDVNILKGVGEDNKTGLDFNFFKGVGEDNKTGLDVNLAKEVEGDDFGINASIIYRKVGSVNKTSLSYASFYDKINKIGDYAFALQFSGIYNNAKEVSDKGAVLQLGLLNKIGDNYSLFVNAKGLKNIPEIIKKAFKRKDKGLEEKLSLYIEVKK